jgi:hypothetical protein
MLIKTTILILAIAATLVTGSVIGAQLTYAQQGSSTNPNFKVLEITSSPPRYKVAIPVDWIGPTLPYNNPGDVYFHSPDGSKGVLVSFRFPGFYRIEDFISAEIQNSASNGKSPIQDLQASWQQAYPTRVLIYPDHISIWISAWSRFLNIVTTTGAVMNDQTINQILGSFQIQTPTADEQQLISYENNMFYCTAMKALSTFPGSRYDVIC